MIYRYLLDTGVLSRYYSDEIRLPIEIFAFGCISIITKIELYNWLSAYNVDRTTRIRILKSIQELKVIHFNENISKLVEAHADKNLNSKPSDTIIGITAIYHNLELHTGDRHDFDVFNKLRKVYYPQKKIK